MALFFVKRAQQNLVLINIIKTARILASIKLFKIFVEFHFDNKNWEAFFSEFDRWLIQKISKLRSTAFLIKDLEYLSFTLLGNPIPLISVCINLMKQ